MLSAYLEVSNMNVTQVLDKFASQSYHKIACLWQYAHDVRANVYLAAC